VLEALGRSARWKQYGAARKTGTHENTYQWVQKFLDTSDADDNATGPRVRDLVRRKNCGTPRSETLKFALQVHQHPHGESRRRLDVRVHRKKLKPRFIAILPSFRRRLHRPGGNYFPTPDDVYSTCVGSCG